MIILFGFLCLQAAWTSSRLLPRARPWRACSEQQHSPVGEAGLVQQQQTKAKQSTSAVVGPSLTQQVLAAAEAALADLLVAVDAAAACAAAREAVKPLLCLGKSAGRATAVAAVSAGLRSLTEAVSAGKEADAAQLLAVSYGLPQLAGLKSQAPCTPSAPVQQAVGGKRPAVAAATEEASPDKLQRIEDSPCSGCSAVDGEQIVCDFCESTWHMSVPCACCCARGHVVVTSLLGSSW